MSKIAILTFSNTLNYGATMQCYALSQYLISKGHDVSVLDYRNRKIELSGKRRFTAISSVKDLILWILTHREFNKRELLFEDFNSQYINFVQCKDVEQLEKLSYDYDYYIVGSDQVWNYSLTKSDTTFFFPFKSAKAKKLSYSASFGSGGIEENQWDEIKNYLLDFSAISMREKQGAETLKKYTGIDSHITLDPTLILDKSIWKSMAKPISLKQKYVLAYVISERERVTEAALKIGSELNLPVIILQTGTIHSTKGATDIKGAGPQDFINYFFNAEYVVTDSFHGTCFSLIFEKDFYCVLKSSKGSNSRIVDLLDSLGLNQRYEKASTEKIRFEIVNDKLETLANISRSFLNESTGLNVK